MRLIDADALKGEKFYSHERHENCVSVYAIDTMPTIEPERPHGEWTEEFDESANPFFQRRWRCSACNDYNYYGRPDFCPCCGADMRPKEGDEE